MIIFGIIMASIVMYLVIGLIASRIARPAIIRHSMRSAKSLGRSGDYCDKCYRTIFHRPEDVDRHRARHLTWNMILLWPVQSWALAINTSLATALDEADPRLQEIRLEEQAARIKELEKELLQ